MIEWPLRDVFYSGGLQQVVCEGLVLGPLEFIISNLDENVIDLFNKFVVWTMYPKIFAHIDEGKGAKCPFHPDYNVQGTMYLYRKISLICQS